METAEEVGHGQRISREVIVSSSAQCFCITLDVDEEVACFEFFLLRPLFPDMFVALQ